MTVKGRRIIKRAVVSLNEAAEIGNVHNIIFDREARMSALVVRKRKSRDLAASEIANVHALGRDAITLESGEELLAGERIEDLHASPNLLQLVGCRVITDGGIYLGKVRDLVLDTEQRRIVEFDVAGPGVLGRLRWDRIPATGHLRFGTELVIVPNRVELRGAVTLEGMGEPATAPQVVEMQPPIILPRPAQAPISRAHLTPISARAEAAENGEEELSRAVGS